MIKVAILGAGGLGRGMAQMLEHRKGFQLVGIADTEGYAYCDTGLNFKTLQSVAHVHLYPEAGVKTTPKQAIMQLLQAHGSQLDAIFMALPNLPVTFYKDITQQIATETNFKGVIVDALKRTQAVEMLLTINKKLAQEDILYITGAGATPGFLTTIAAVAAQSFVEVKHINIHFGVGVSNWEQYRATIREDFLHMPGFTPAMVEAMTDADIEAELDKRNGLLELVDMEHADDIILELTGLCHRDQITVGGLVDARNAKKPVATTVTIEGVTVAGQTTKHQFIVGNETTMVDNVCGPACGFMASGVQLYNLGLRGLKTSAEVMPRFSAEGIHKQVAQSL
jgi:hypothetical protein